MPINDPTTQTIQIPQTWIGKTGSALLRILRSPYKGGRCTLAPIAPRARPDIIGMPSVATAPSFPRITLSPQQARLCRRIVRHYESRRVCPNVPNRGIMITGPSGSGKSTTARAAIKHLLEHHRQIAPHSLGITINLSAPGWIPLGAKEDPTLRVIFSRVTENLKTRGRSWRPEPPTVFFYVDEIDSLQGVSRGRHGNGAYFMSVTEEIKALCEREPSLFHHFVSRNNRGVKKLAFFEQALAKSFLVLCGAFETNGMTPFDRQGQIPRPYQGSDHGWTPDDLQLYSRLSWASLGPPTHEDLRAIGTRLCQGPAEEWLTAKLDAMVTEANRAVCPIRKLEHLILEEAARILEINEDVGGYPPYP